LEDADKILNKQSRSFGWLWKHCLSYTSEPRITYSFCWAQLFFLLFFVECYRQLVVLSFNLACSCNSDI